MVRVCKLCVLLSILSMFSSTVHADSEPSFNYSTTWRIIYFQGESLFVNQRPDNEYSPLQAFIFIFEILNKYVYQIQKFNQADTGAEISELGIWAQIYLVNDVSYQELFIGDHTLSDGRGWVIMNDEDYSRLSKLLLHRKEVRGDPFDGDKEKTLKDLSWKGGEGQHLDDFDTHFRIPKSIDGKENEPESRQPLDSSKAINLDRAISKTHSSVSDSQTKINADAHRSVQSITNTQIQIADQKLTKLLEANVDEVTTTHRADNISRLVTWLFILTCGCIVFYFVRRKK
jgi:hypothetical protein